MSFHRHPDYNSDAIRTALKAHNLPVDTPSMLADSFRIGWVAALNHLAKTDNQ